MKIYLGKDISELYLDCVARMEDEEYCREVVRALKQASKGKYVYGSFPKFHLALPDLEYFAHVFTDEKKNRIVVALHHRSHTVFLHFIRNGNKFVLGHAEVLNSEIAAMGNERPPL
jgi:hypothetical protein